MNKIISIGLFLIICLCSCGIDNYSYIQRYTGLDVREGSVIYEKDTHGGIQGEGDYGIKISFDDDQNKDLINQISENDKWKQLPVSNDLKSYMKDVHYGIPYQSENGYYIFINKNSPQDDVWFSRNFIIVIYETEEKTFYYSECDR